MDWEEFQKDSPECVPSMEVLSCWILILMKSYSKMERLLESERAKRLPSAPRLSATQPMLWSVVLRTDWRVLEKSSDVSAFSITWSQKLKRFPQSRLSSHKDKLEETQIFSSWWSAPSTRSASKGITLPLSPQTRRLTTQRRKFSLLSIWLEKSEKNSWTSLSNISQIQSTTKATMVYTSATLWTQLPTSNQKPRMSWISTEESLEKRLIWLTSQRIKTNEKYSSKNS